MAKITTPKFWRRLMRIEEIKHYDKNGKCIWEAYDIPNILHLEGEEFILQLAFDTDAGATVPTNYYLGLDDRSTISTLDTLADLVDEPSIGVNGYERQPISSTSGFFIQNVSGNMIAQSIIVTFSAIGGNWGPISNAFLATTDDNTGILMATAALTASRTVLTGETFSMRISLSLAQCP